MYRLEPTYEPLEIPGYAPTTVEPGKVFAFTPDFQPYSEGPFASFTAASVSLCKPGKTPRGLRNTIVRALNSIQLVDTSAGLLYFVQNPNSTDRFTLNHTGHYPCVLHDLVTNTNVEFKGLKPLVAHLY